jgi:hypothetical protein
MKISGKPMAWREIGEEKAMAWRQKSMNNGGVKSAEEKMKTSISEMVKMKWHRQKI